MGRLNRISEFKQPVEVDSTGKQVALENVDPDDGGVFDVYGRNGSGQWGMRTDASLQTGGGGGGSDGYDFVKTSGYSNLRDALIDAQAAQKPVLVDSVILLDHPDAQKFDIQSITDASVTVALDDVVAERNGPEFPINTSATPKEIDPGTGKTTYLDNVLRDYSVIAPLRAEAAVDKGNGIVAIPTTRQRMSPGMKVRLNGTVGYAGATFEVVANTEIWNDPNWIWIKATFVAEVFTTAMSVERGLIGIPVDDHTFSELTDNSDIQARDLYIEIWDSSTYLDGQVLKADRYATGSHNPNEVVVEGFYQATSFTQGMVGQAHVKLKSTANGFTGNGQSFRLFCTIANTPGGRYDGTHRVVYVDNPNTSPRDRDPDFFGIEGISFNRDGMTMGGTATVTFHMIAMGTISANPSISNGGRVRISGFTGADEGYNSLYLKQPNPPPFTVLLNKIFEPVTVTPGTQKWTIARFDVNFNTTIFFQDPRYYIQIAPHSNLYVTTPINIVPWKMFDLVDKSYDLETRTLFRIEQNGYESNPLHWGMDLDNTSHTITPTHDHAMIAAWNTAIDTRCSLVFPAGLIIFSGYIVGINVQGMGTEDIRGSAVLQTRLRLARGSNRPLMWNNDQGYHNYRIYNFALNGNWAASQDNVQGNNLNGCIHPQTPMLQLWGFNCNVDHLQVDQSPGGGILCRPGQANEMNISNVESEVNKTYGLHIHGFLRVSLFMMSFEQNQIGLLCSPNPNDTSWANPDSLNMSLDGCYLEANGRPIVLAGVRTVLLRNFRAGDNGRVFLENWQGVGCVGCEVDANNSSVFRLEVSNDARGCTCILPSEGSANTIIEDYSMGMKYIRKGESPLSIPEGQMEQGNNFLNNSHVSALGGGTVTSPWGDGTNKWKGSTFFDEQVAFDAAIGHASRFQADENTTTQQVQIDMPSGSVFNTVYVRFLWEAHPAWHIRFQITDLANSNDQYNFRFKNWTPIAQSGAENTLFLPAQGKREFLQIPIEGLGINRRFRMRVTYTLGPSVGSSTFTMQTTPFIWEYMQITDDAGQGLLHIRNGDIINVGALGQITNPKFVANGQIKNSDRAISIDTTGGAFTLDCPEYPIPGQSHKITFAHTLTGSNPVTIDGGSRNVNGAGTFEVTQATDYTDFEVTYDETGDEWFVND